MLFSPHNSLNHNNTRVWRFMLLTPRRNSMIRIQIRWFLLSFLHRKEIYSRHVWVHWCVRGPTWVQAHGLNGFCLHQSNGRHKGSFWSCHILQKLHSDVIMGCFEKQQAAIDRKHRLEQCWPFVSVWELSVKEPQRWERAGRAAFSHWLEGTTFLQGCSSSGATGQGEKKRRRMIYQMLCVNAYKERCSGPLYRTFNKQKVWNITRQWEAPQRNIKR